MSNFTVYYPKAIIVPQGETKPMWAPEGAIYVEQVDEGGGVFLEISQLDVFDREQKLRLTYQELEQVYVTARKMHSINTPSMV
jgi:hypothetical protein